MILSASTHRDLWENLKRMKKEKTRSHAPLLASGPGFYTCKSSFLFMEHNQAKHHVTSTVQGRASSCWSCSVICPSTGHPREPGKLLLPRMVAEHTGASSEELSWCCSFIFTCGKQGGHMLACLFLLTFLLSLLPVSPAPSLVLYHCLLSTGILAHSYVWHFFSLLPASVSPILAHLKKTTTTKKCNLSVSEMPVLVKPPRTEALPPIPPVLHYL